MEDPFEIDGAPLFMTLVSRFSGMRFTWLERHFGVTQTFVPLGAVPALVAVAAPTDPEDPEAIPDGRGRARVRPRQGHAGMC